MREIKRKQYWPISALLAFMIILAIGYFLVYPMIGQLKDVKTQVEAQTKDNNDLQNKITTLKNLQEEMSQNTQKVSMLEIGIPADDDQAEILATLSGIAANTGTTIKTVAQSKSPSDDMTQIVISCETSYNGFKLFLDSLESNIRFSQVNNISLTRTTKSENAEAYLLANLTIDMLKFSGKTTEQTNEQSEEGINE